jgi:hypothetical protein
MLVEGSGISPEVVGERGYFTAQDPAELERFGFPPYQRRVPALVIPSFGVDGTLRCHRIRPEEPRERTDSPGRHVKYEHPAGTGLWLDVPPRSRPALSQGGKALWFVEGEKKADALASAGECVVGLMGVWGWTRGGLPLPDFDGIGCIGREVFVCFDSDAARNVQVRLARARLARYLLARGAQVRIVEVPDAPDGSKQGPDDYLIAGGTVGGLRELARDFMGFEPDAAEWPVMAEEAYYGLAGEIVRAIEPNTESDPAGLLVMLVAALGNVIGRGAYFVVEDDRHYCKVFVVLVGETSKGRKGTGLNRIRRLMGRVDEEWSERCIASGLASGEGLVHRLRDPLEKEDADGDPKVVDPGAADKRVLVEEAEFASPLTVMRRDGNTLSMVVRNLWDDKPLQNLSKNNPEKASYTHGTIIGNISRPELLRHLNEEKLGGGIGNRFLFVLVARSKSLPHGGRRDIYTEDHVRHLQEAIEFGKQEREIALSAEVEEEYGYSARVLWEEVYPALSEGKPGLYGAVISRAEAYVRRIATVYAVLDRSEEVGVAHLLAALAVWQYCEESACQIFGDRTGDGLADELLEALSDAEDEGMTRSEIHDYFGRNQKGPRLGAVLRDLERQGLARKEKEKGNGPGRRPERWYAREGQ